MPFMQLRLNSLTYHHEIWYGGIILQRPKEQHTVNVHGLFISLRFQDGSCSIILFSNIYTHKQSGWFYRNVEPLWKTNSHFQHLRTVRTFNNRCCTEKYSAKKANDHRTTLKLSKLLIYWCFFLWHLYDLILQQVKQTLFVHN